MLRNVHDICQGEVTIFFALSDVLRHASDPLDVLFGRAASPLACIADIATARQFWRSSGMRKKMIPRKPQMA
jgi:hypothetical protein